MKESFFRCLRREASTSSCHSEPTKNSSAAGIQYTAARCILKAGKNSVQATQVGHYFPAGETNLVWPTLSLATACIWFVLFNRSHHSLTTWLDLKRHIALVMPDPTITSTQEIDALQEKGTLLPIWVTHIMKDNESTWWLDQVQMFR